MNSKIKIYKGIGAGKVEQVVYFLDHLLIFGSGHSQLSVEEKEALALNSYGKGSKINMTALSVPCHGRLALSVPGEGKLGL